MTRIVIVANFCRGLDGTNHSRFIYLAEMLNATGRYDVELVTSDFQHLTKMRINEANVSKYNFKIKLCHEPGYISHKGAKRLISHYRWGKNVLRYIKSQPQPDIIYCAIPSLTAAHDLALYCKRKDIKFVIDVQDLWPEAILMLADNALVRYATWPMKKYVETAYRNADAIVAVSETYAARAKRVNVKDAKTLAVFLGNDGQRFSDARDKYTLSENKLTIGYIGTLSYSYDIGCVIEAIGLLNASGKYGNIKFLVMGDGPLKTKFQEIANSRGVSCEFTGMLPYEQMVGRLCKCDILVNPIVKGAAASIINKTGDYALAGLPVVNTQENDEYRDLIDTYDCGINCKPGDAADVASALGSLIDNPSLRHKMGENSRQLGITYFDRRSSYSKIISLLEKVITTEQNG